MMKFVSERWNGKQPQIEVTEDAYDLKALSEVKHPELDRSDRDYPDYDCYDDDSAA